MRRGFAFIIIIAFVLSACVESLDVFYRDNHALVIDGSITSEPGIYVVKVYYTTGFNVRSDYVTSAQVAIVDDLGNRELLTYDEYGRYETRENFAGEFGRIYHLEVELETGERYLSRPELMKKPPNINKVWYERGDHVLNIYANFTDRPDEENYYRWRYKGTYEVEAPFASPPVRRCWTNEFDYESFNIDSDQFTDGVTRDTYVAALKFDQKLNYGYFLNVQLQSLSEETYNYLRALKNQIDNKGTIFETTPYTLSGMIYNQTDPDEIVLGYFQVSGVSTKAVFIDQYAGEFGPITCDPNPQMPSRCLNCLLIGINPKNEKPDFWPK